MNLIIPQAQSQLIESFSPLVATQLPKLNLGISLWSHLNELHCCSIKSLSNYLINYPVHWLCYKF